MLPKNTMKHIIVEMRSSMMLSTQLWSLRFLLCCDAKVSQDVYYIPTDKGWEDADIFNMGHLVKEKREVWWATWRWNGWVQDHDTLREWEEWEAHCREQREAADKRALAESAAEAVASPGAKSSVAVARQRHTRVA